MQTFVDLSERVAGHGDRIVLSFEGRHFSGAEITAEARKVARALLAGNVVKGDRICVWLPNCPEFIILELAVTMIGAILVPVHSRYGAVELAAILRHAAPVALFYDRRFRDIDFDVILDKVCPELSAAAGAGKPDDTACPPLVVCLNDSDLDRVIDWGCFILRGNDISAARLHETTGRVTPEDPAICIFTSGTTGTPKGALLSHAAILTTETAVGDLMGIRAGDRVLYSAPLPSVFGCCNALVASWSHDACLVLTSTFDAGEVLDTIEREACAVIYGVPTMYLMLLNHPAFQPHRTRSLRGGIVGGAPCSIELARAIVGDLGMSELVSGYGMSETCAVITLTRIGDPLDIVTGTVGRPLPGVEVRICDRDADTVLERDCEGEICVRGSNLMGGYFAGEGRELIRPFADGWFRTGDLGALGTDGNLRITGRVSDMLLVGGFNVYPAEIESLLARHPDVIQAYVVGMPDERMGERPAAFVQTRPGGAVTSDDLSRFCLDNLAKYKLPTRFFFVDDFPMTPLGKIQKFELKKMAREAIT